MIHHAIAIEKNSKQNLHNWSNLTGFFRSWLLWTLPYTYDLSPVMTFMSKYGSSLNVVNISWAMSMRCCFCSKFSNFGTIFAALCFMSKTSVKIVWHESNDMPTSSATSLIAIRRLSKIIQCSSVVDVLGTSKSFLRGNYLRNNFCFIFRFDVGPGVRTTVSRLISLHTTY